MHCIGRCTYADDGGLGVEEWKQVVNENAAKASRNGSAYKD